jgi:hypothetical protein
MRYFVEIVKENDHYRGFIHQGNPAIAQPINNLLLHPEAEVSIKGESYKIGKLVQALIDYKPEDLRIAFEERGQLEIGQYLYARVFGKRPHSELKRSRDETVDLRIVTNDEHIARLPWVLLSNQGVFLAAAGWSVSIARYSAVSDCELPPEPKMLIIAPEPAGVEKTRATAHLDTLEYRLSSYDFRLSRDFNIKIAETWEDFRRLLAEFKPHIIYYYGHGIGDQFHSRLLFATGAQRKRTDKPVADFAQCLRDLPEPPKIVYLNCCSGDAGGFLGAGWQLGEFIPAVITNRTVSYIDAAQAQALAFWQSVLLNGQSPHLAMSDIRGKLIDLDLSFQDARWMTPVLHCHYANWKSTPPRRVDPLEHDPHWHLKLDRVLQFSTVAFQTRQMLRERRPRSLAYVWYGQEGQGVDIFHKRLRVELREDISTHAHFLEVQPEWPMDLYHPERSFADMLCEAFDVRSLPDIPRCIRAHTRGATGRQTLVYVRHQPVRSAQLINPRTLKAYLNWWDKTFAPLLSEHFYGLLTVSFVVNNPARFRKAVLEQERVYDIELSETVFRLLDEMERIGLKDLFDFLQTHNIRLPRDHKDRMLQDILEKTKGNYELTIDELKKLVERAWDITDEEMPRPGEAEEEFDY